MLTTALPMIEKVERAEDFCGKPSFLTTLTNNFVLAITVGKRRLDPSARADHDKPTGRGRLYFSLGSETNVIENLLNRGREPRDLYKQLLEHVFGSLVHAGLASPEDPLVQEPLKHCRWSKHAGCTMCPCSPGFIVDGLIGVDVWISVYSSQAEYDQVQAQLAQRKAEYEVKKRAKRLDDLKAELAKLRERESQIAMEMEMISLGQEVGA